MSWYRSKWSNMFNKNTCHTNNEYNKLSILYRLIWNTNGGVAQDTCTMKLCIVINFEIRQLLWLITGFATRITQLITLPEYLSSPPILSGVRVVTRSLLVCVMFCRSFFVLLSFFIWSLFCLSFDLRILIIPLISSNSSYFWPVANMEL